jgi:hypothetical protein
MGRSKFRRNRIPGYPGSETQPEAPHVAFAFGSNLSLGVPHARLLIRTLLQTLCDRVKEIPVLESKAALEIPPHNDTQAGYSYKEN